MSAPKSMSTLSGFPNSGSANCKFNKWFHLGSRVTSCVGIFEIIFGNMIVSMFTVFPFPSTRVTLKCTMLCGVDYDGEFLCHKFWRCSVDAVNAAAEPIAPI